MTGIQDKGKRGSAPLPLTLALPQLLLDILQECTVLRTLLKEIGQTDILANPAKPQKRFPAVTRLAGPNARAYVKTYPTKGILRLPTEITMSRMRINATKRRSGSQGPKARAGFLINGSHPAIKSH